MPSTQVIVGAAAGCLFACGLFTGQGMAQTANTDPVGKLIQFLHPGEQETKPPGRSTAIHSSKDHLVAKRPALTKHPHPKKAPQMGHRS
jgi:hypothetical protein